MADVAGKYRLGKRIGGGGMAEVLEAETVGAEGFARPVAVKRIHPSYSSDESFGEMFVNEARLASLLHHANIVSVLDFARDPEGRYLLVMELVKGVDLRRLADSGRLPPAVALFIISEVLRGLAYAHELVFEGRHLGIIHRDISPHNVMISWNGSVKVVDFGIAKAAASSEASKSGSLKGKIGYMSPEQAHGLELDGRSDVFSVGVVLHELLTGKRLFAGSTEPEILARLLNQPIAKPSASARDIPQDLDDVVMAMLERDRDKRVASAAVALEALMATSATSVRAALDLKELMRARFAELIPPSADLSTPHRLPRGASQTPILPPPPGAVAATRIERPVAGKTKTRTPRLDAEVAPDGLAFANTALSDSRVSPAPAAVEESGGAAGAQRGKRAIAVVAMVVVLALVAVVGAVASRSNDVRSGADPAATTSADAAVPVVVEADSADAEGPVAATDERSTVAIDASVRDAGPRPAVDGAPARRTGTLEVYVTPWATVRVGRQRAATPATMTLDPGRHRVRITNDELGKRETVRVEIVPGKTAVIRRAWQ